MALPDLTSSYVPSLESQIVVLSVYSYEFPLFFVMNTIILEKAIHSDTPVEVPWSDWGSQRACYFPLHSSYAFDIFGSKLTVRRTPERGEGPKGLLLSTESHVCDFNKQVIPRAENSYDCSSANSIIHKPGRLAHSSSDSDGDIISNYPRLPYAFPESSISR
ncbi:hypothetical protein AZE42_11914 [Rhizopogon vesiculosus]|uniref:Uncharacterized protein n=1 Tax=Rhizopogon vesiculosus TaxID=180088 RepID=A0A1J8QE46_9AGAM|nr:hypothetical protein AZE42_11914 [Rhizopogon vesiculosus]